MVAVFGRRSPGAAADQGHEPDWSEVFLAQEIALTLNCDQPLIVQYFIYFKRLISLQTAMARTSYADELQEIINRGPAALNPTVGSADRG